MASGYVKLIKSSASLLHSGIRGALQEVASFPTATHSRSGPSPTIFPRSATTAATLAAISTLITPAPLLTPRCHRQTSLPATIDSYLIRHCRSYSEVIFRIVCLRNCVHYGEQDAAIIDCNCFESGDDMAGPLIISITVAELPIKLYQVHLNML